MFDVVAVRKYYPLLALLCVAAYLPALNNGFIADDYVLLEYSDRLANDFFFLFNFPPLNFRLTSVALYHALKSSFGYRAEFFYAFNILLHLANAVFLSKLIELMTGDPRVSRLAAVFFAVFQAPQEAVMWLTAMGETLQGLFVLLTLIMWIKRRYGLSALFYFFALFSKESALLVLVFVPFVQWHQRKKLFPAACGALLIPSLVFGAAFLYTWSTNHLIQKDVYGVSWTAPLVEGKTLLRLIWPWLIAAIALFRWDARRWPDPPRIGGFVACMAVTLLPYIFLKYSTYLPSREVYLASMLLAWILASLTMELKTAKLRTAFIAAFLVVNLSYLWFQKDAQFENRAAPTNELLRLLRAHRPTQILIFDFAYPQPDTAKAVSWLVPGWTRDLVGVNGTGETCEDCVKLRWDAKTRTYSGHWPD